MALLAGAVCGFLPAFASPALKWALVVLAAVGWIAWWGGRGRVTAGALAVAFFYAAAILAADARDRALHTPLRTLLDCEVGGFALETSGPGARHDPMPVRALKCIGRWVTSPPLNRIFPFSGGISPTTM
jgi:hypothetical protein